MSVNKDAYQKRNLNKWPVRLPLKLLYLLICHDKVNIGLPLSSGLVYISTKQNKTHTKKKNENKNENKNKNKNKANKQKTKLNKKQTNKQQTQKTKTKNKTTKKKSDCQRDTNMRNVGCSITIVPPAKWEILKILESTCRKTW